MLNILNSIFCQLWPPFPSVSPASGPRLRGPPAAAAAAAVRPPEGPAAVRAPGPPAEIQRPGHQLQAGGGARLQVSGGSIMSGKGHIMTDLDFFFVQDQGVSQNTFTKKTNID